MPPKRKDFLKPKPKGRAKAQEPQTENDFLDAADEFEQVAGKWRAGDAVKAARFFNRAIEAYSEGLKRYPQSFDLAYNKSVYMPPQCTASANNEQGKPPICYHRR